jgi:hypothetical protein
MVTLIFSSLGNLLFKGCTGHVLENPAFGRGGSIFFPTGTIVPRKSGRINRVKCLYFGKTHGIF